MNKFLKGVIVTSSIVTVGSSLYSLYKYIRDEFKPEYKCIRTVSDTISEEELNEIYGDYCTLDYCPLDIGKNSIVHALLSYAMVSLNTRCDLQVIQKCEETDDYVLINCTEANARNLVFYIRKTGELSINRFAAK